MKSNYTNRPTEAFPEETRLVRQAKSGDANAFAQLYDVYVEHVYRFVQFRVTDDMAAEGITFQVFLNAWEYLDRYQKRGLHFVSWLYTIAGNQVIDYYRTHKKTVAFDDGFVLATEGRASVEEVQDKFDLQAMRDALQFLTEEQQQVLILKYIAGLPTKNIARMMAKREDAVRALQMHALQILAIYMQEKEII